MNQTNLRNNIILTLFCAIIILLTVVPQLGYISLPFLPVGITIVHIPVIIGAILLGRKSGIILGLVFGLSSLYVAYFRPTTPFDYFFQNVLISVLPRVLFGLFTYYVYSYFKNLFSTSKKSYLYLIPTLIAVFGAMYYSMTQYTDWNIYFVVFVCLFFVSVLFYVYKTADNYVASVFPTAIISTLIHSFLVLGSIAVVKNAELTELLGGATITSFLLSVIAVNALVESIVGAIIVTPVVKPLLKLTGGSR